MIGVTATALRSLLHERGTRTTNNQIAEGKSKTGWSDDVAGEKIRCASARNTSRDTQREGRVVCDALRVRAIKNSGYGVLIVD